MRIAFVSYEAPPDTLIGGIGTYVGQAARTLAARGHEVEVFTASPDASAPLRENGYLTHRLRCDPSFQQRLAFSEAAGRLFAARHAREPFDVLEGAEFLADARVAKELVPDIPLVVKLHMSMTLIRRLNRPPSAPIAAIKKLIKNTIQPILRLERWRNREFDFEGLELPHLLQADVITTPCRAIARITARMWNLDRARIFEVPNAFVPPESLLAIPPDTRTNTIGYVGRLEHRKGVIDLARAIPLILKQFPDTRFLFAGATLDSPAEGVTMEDFLKSMIGPAIRQVTFLGKMAYEKMAGVYGAMDIAVLPSLWENFPNSCLEAMAAARGVVGSSAGGMEQQLDAGKAGLLIRPKSPRLIAHAACRLLANPELRMELGRRARARVITEYGENCVGPLMEQSYERAIRGRDAGGQNGRRHLDPETLHA